MPQASPRGTYLVIAEALRKMVQGENPPTVLPSEAALMDKHGVSRTTVRRALRALAEDGLVESTPGVGWSIVGPGADRRPLAERMAEVIQSDGLTEGDAFPSEARLCERFAASRTSVRQALAQLAGRGLLTTVHGKGRTVRALPDSDVSP